MLRVIQSVKIMALFFCLFLGITSFAHAGTPISDRMEVEAGVKTEKIRCFIIMDRSNYTGKKPL